MHFKGYLHNNLKMNNVALEDKFQLFNPIVIDFGKSTKIEGPMKKSMRKASRKSEIVNGTKAQSTASNVY